MQLRTPTAAAWALVALIATIASARLGLAIADSDPTQTIDGVRTPEGGVATAVFEAVALTAFAGIGAFVASRRPRNPIGWLLCAAPFGLAVGVLSERLAWHSLLDDRALNSSAELMLWIPNWTWVLTVVPVFSVVPLLFPSGAPLTPRWRVVGWMALGGGCALLLGYAFAPGELESYSGVENPLGVGGGLGRAIEALALIGFGLVVVATLAAATSLAMRFRRSHGIERQQLKWVWAAAALLVLSFVASALVESAVSAEAGWPILLAGLLGVPGAVAMAILRHRLYDIDVVVNRTLVYGSLTATLVLSYLACVLVLQLVLRPLTEQSNLAIAGSTLAVAALFGPARQRIQAIVDRRFYRRKYDAARTLEAFTTRLRDEVDIESLRSDLRGVLQETLQPAHVSLWLRAAEPGGPARVRPGSTT